MKRAYKITPVSLYDVRGLESWLEDMARRGLSVKKLRPLFSTFERGPSRPLRFRAEPLRRSLDEEPPQAMLDLYQDFGWDLVCETPELLIFATGDENAPEPHSDPALQGQLWKKLYRSRRRGFFFDLAAALLLLFGVPLLLFGGGTPVLTLLTTAAPILILYLVPALMILPGLWADVQRLDLLVRQLEAGVPMSHRSFYPRRRWGELVNFCFLWVLLAGIVVSQMILPFLGTGIRPLDELSAFTPLSLAELEGEGFTPTHYTFGSSPSLDPDGQLRQKDYGNFCAVEHSLLCPDQWEVVQTGDVDPDSWVRMEIHWYDLPGWLSGLSAPLARELLGSAMGLHRDIWWTDGGQDRVWTVNYYPREDASLLAVANSGPDGFQAAAVAVRDKAAVVTYTGQGDLAEYLDEIMGMVQ